MEKKIAMKILKNFRDESTLFSIRTALDTIISELRESEDERIRKAIHIYLDWLDGRRDYQPKGEYTIKDMIAWLEKQGENTLVEEIKRIKEILLKEKEKETSLHTKISLGGRIAMLEELLVFANEKQDEQKPTENFIEIWKDMRLEVYQQVSGNRHEPNYSDDNTKMFSLNDIDEIIEKIAEKQSESKPQGKTAFETIKEEKVDNQNCVKPADKVEPKFHEGAWIVSNKDNTVHQVKTVIENVSNGEYAYDLIDGGYVSTSYESDYHLWTIEDAKDGDVLAVTMYPEGTWIGIFKEQNGSTFSSYCFVNTVGIFKQGSYGHGSGKAIHPATKEQRNLLFSEMKEAGYEWDAEKKELRKIGDEDPKKVSNKFDITTLQPFDKVLVRDNAALRWGISLYGYYNRDNKYPFVCNSTCWKQCIPYNDDTKHLIGTTDDAPDFYKTWEL